MQVDWDLAFRIGLPFATLFAGVAINRAFERRSKLIAYYGHVSAHRIQPVPPNTEVFFVNTHSIVLRNAGRLLTKNIRVHHRIRPVNIDVVPAVPHTFETMADGSTDLCIPTLPPGSEITISYLYYDPLTWDQINGFIVSDDGQAKVVKTVHATLWPKWVTLSLAILVLIGTITLLYAAVLMGQRLL